METADGSSLRGVRAWSRSIHKAAGRVPAGQNADDYLLPLIEQTTTGDLTEELDLVPQPVPGGVPAWQHSVQHINQSFLGPDEANILKDDAKCMRQGQREDLPSYNRRFLKAVDYAYPLPRQPDTEEMLTDLYMGSLRNGRIKDLVFAHDPQLVQLQPTIQVALAAYSRQRRKDRVMRDLRGEEPMEVDLVDDDDNDDDACAVAQAVPTVRDTLSALASTLRTLQKDVQGLKQRNDRFNPRPRGSQQQHSQHHNRCFYCNKPGHKKVECRKRARDMAAKQHQGN